MCRRNLECERIAMGGEGKKRNVHKSLISRGRKKERTGKKSKLHFFLPTLSLDRKTAFFAWWLRVGNERSKRRIREVYM